MICRRALLPPTSLRAPYENCADGHALRSNHIGFVSACRAEQQRKRDEELIAAFPALQAVVMRGFSILFIVAMAFTSNHRAPQHVPSLLLRSGNAFLPALRRTHDPAAPESPAGGPVRATPETCRPAQLATAHCAASASAGWDDLQARAAGAGTGSSGRRLQSLRPPAAWADCAPDPGSAGRFCPGR